MLPGVMLWRDGLRGRKLWKGVTVRQMSVRVVDSVHDDGAP
jgi:hypothetical protein